MRSKFEKEVARYLKQNKVKFEYEPKDKIVKYQIPVTNHKYTPDFVIDGVMYETKGYIRSVAERRKYVYVAEQNPDLKLVMVFQNPNLPIRKGSKTTYKMWFEKNGVQTMSIKEFKKKYENKTESTK